MQKTYTPDFLNKRAIKNKGEVEQVRVKGDHEPIIEPEIWDAVQLELQRRHRYTEEHNIRFRGRNSDVQPFFLQGDLWRLWHSVLEAHMVQKPQAD